MKDIKVEQIENFKKFVDSMEVGVTYLLPDNSKYKKYSTIYS